MSRRAKISSSLPRQNSARRARTHMLPWTHRRHWSRIVSRAASVFATTARLPSPARPSRLPPAHRTRALLDVAESVWRAPHRPRTAQQATSKIAQPSRAIYQLHTVRPAGLPPPPHPAPRPRLQTPCFNTEVSQVNKKFTIFHTETPRSKSDKSSWLWTWPGASGVGRSGARGCGSALCARA